MNSHLHDLAAAYALDALDASEIRAFERHLATCETCETDVREMRETASALATSTAEHPPGALKAAVLDALPTTPQVAASSTVTSLAERRTHASRASRWLAGVAAAAVVVAGGLGVAAYQANERANDVQATAEQVAGVLADPDAQVERGNVAGGGAGTLVLSPSTGQAVFLTDDLPDVESAETYQLWAIDDAGATSLGLLEPDAGRATQLVDIPGGSTTFGMTVEPEGGSEQPTTDPILLLDLLPA